MCGIICLLQYGGQEINLMNALVCLDKLTSRGPDKKTYIIVKINDQLQIFIGFARLAIMDTSDAGQQPFVDESGNHVICNGEIYNYKDLQKRYEIDLKTSSDCEILLPVFNKLGFEYTIRDELDGEFALILLDKLHSQLYAGRDRFGVRPLYYGFSNADKLIGFASELKVLHSVMEFVNQVKPNIYFNIDLDETNDDLSLLLHQKEYYSFDSLIANIGLDNIGYIHEQVNYYLTEAVKKRLHADRPIGFLLSGGLDSSLIVSIATRILGPDNIVCFSIGIENSPDVEAAKKVVEYLGIKHHHIVPFTVEQGLNELPEVIKTIETYDITTIRASTPQYIMAKYISEHSDIKVLLSGEGSDEIHGSYRYFRKAPNMAQFHWETLRLLEELYMFDNQRTDRTMADNGLEVRVPFLDVEYVEFITRIKPDLLMYRDDYMEKKIIRDSFKGYLPDEILYRSKEAFSDAVSSNEINWAKTIQLVVEKEISNEELINHSFTFNPPRTKDALYFRKVFESFYPGRDCVIPHYWLPKFQEEEVLDPSARVLNCY